MIGLISPLNMQVHYISFSAHADSDQTSAFLDEFMPPNIILVHGEANEMGRLQQKLANQFANRNTKILAPKNCQSVEMYFSSEKMAKTIGVLAEKTPEVGETVSGLLVKKGFTYQKMAPNDLHVFSQLTTANITQRVAVPYNGAFGVIKHRLKQIYESVESPNGETDVPTIVVHEKVTIKQESDKHITLQWSSDPVSDMVSDSVVAMVLNISREGLNMMPTEEMNNSAEDMEKMEKKIIYSLFVSTFGDVKICEENKFVITVDGDVAHVDAKNGEVECENDGLKYRIKTALNRIRGATRSIPLPSA